MVDLTQLGHSAGEGRAGIPDPAPATQKSMNDLCTMSSLTASGKKLLGVHLNLLVD